MRKQGVWLKLYALLALVCLVLPASARITSCLDRAKGMTCCMSLAAKASKPKVVEHVHDCCHPESAVKSADSEPSVSEGAVPCHCSAKTIPVQPAQASTLGVEQGSDDLITLTVANPDLKILSAPDHSARIFFGDSSPPDEPHGSASQGRAPPVSVL